MPLFFDLTHLRSLGKKSKNEFVRFLALNREFVTYSLRNTRQVHIFFWISKAIRLFVWLFTCFLRIVTWETVLTLLQIKTKTISCWWFLKNTWISKASVVKFWSNWRKYACICIILAVTLIAFAKVQVIWAWKKAISKWQYMK